jgi:Putative peptidoglycan binding domain
MVSAHSNAPPLSASDEPQDVALLQDALATIGFAPARSTGPFNGFDGIWGPATTKAVREFQQQHGVRPVGGWEAGAKTLSALDSLLGKMAPGGSDLPRLPDDPDERFEESSVEEASSLRGPATVRSTTTRGAGQLLQRQSPANPTTCEPPRNDLDEAVKTATAESPSFARALGRVRRRGFEIVRGAPRSSQTILSEKKIFIACDASQAEAVIRVIYEVNNADNEVVFEDSRDKSKFKDGESFAKERISEESITVMHAARMAEEAHRIYSKKIQDLIRPFLVQTPDERTSSSSTRCSRTPRPSPANSPGTATGSSGRNSRSFTNNRPRYPRHRDKASPRRRSQPYSALGRRCAQ